MTAPWIPPQPADALRVLGEQPQLPPSPTIGPQQPMEPYIAALLRAQNQQDQVSGVLNAGQQYLSGGGADLASLLGAIYEAVRGNWQQAGQQAVGALPFVPAVGGFLGRSDDLVVGVTKKVGDMKPKGERWYHPSGRSMILSPSTRKKGGWRLTEISGSGDTPLGHFTGTPEELQKKAAELGFDLTHPPKGSLDEDAAARLDALESADRDTPLDPSETRELESLRALERMLALGANPATPPLGR